MTGVNKSEDTFYWLLTSYEHVESLLSGDTINAFKAFQQSAIVPLH